MHMADALLSPSVGIAMCAVSAGAVAYSAAKTGKDEFSDKKLPLMAVSGAFVFAAQMINFTIPGTGSSGHIGGGILLAALLGGCPALLAITAVLLIQCLFFADGGLLALGCNVFNMGVIPCLVVYPLIFKPLMKKGVTAGRLSAASVTSAAAGLELGAFAVVLQTQLSGITALPFGVFTALMLPIHLAIGVVEGVVTAGTLCFVYKARPELLDCAQAGAERGRLSANKVVAVLACAALATAGLLSMYASGEPDGLEWSIQKTTGAAELEAEGGIYQAAGNIQQSTAFMPDYAYSDAKSDGEGTQAAGLTGALLTFALAGGAGIALAAVRKKRAKRAA